MDKESLRNLIGQLITFMALEVRNDVESKLFGIVLGIIQRRMNQTQLDKV